MSVSEIVIFRFFEEILVIFCTREFLFVTGTKESKLPIGKLDTSRTSIRTGMKTQIYTEKPLKWS